MPLQSPQALEFKKPLKIGIARPSSAHPLSLRQDRPRLALCLLGLLCACSGSIPAWSAETACEAPPTPIHDLRTSGPYQDESGSIPNKAAQRRNDAIREPLNRFLQLATDAADRYHRDGSEADRDCALSILMNWATRDALDGKVSMQGAAVRQWAAGTVALATLKLGAPQRPLPPALRQWLLDRAADTRQYMASRITIEAPYGRSNLYYWSILTLGSIALVVDDPALWAYAKQEYLSVLPMIGEDGTLAAELRRKSRASIYHAFAAQPLVAFATLLEANGEELPQNARDHLDRLVHLVRSIDRGNQQLLATRAHATQLPAGVSAWYPLYTYLQSGRVPLHAASDDDVQRLGGSIRELIAEVDRRRQHEP